MTYPPSRRMFLRAVAFTTIIPGCLDGDIKESNSNNSDEHLDRDPDRIYWGVAIYSELPKDDSTVYPSDHELLKEFEPLEDLLRQVEQEDNLSDRDRIMNEPIDYESEEREESHKVWEEIKADSDGPFFINYGGLYLRIEYVTETDE